MQHKSVVHDSKEVIQSSCRTIILMLHVLTKLLFCF